MAEADRQVIVRVGAEVDPSVSEAAEKAGRAISAGIQGAVDESKLSLAALDQAVKDIYRIEREGGMRVEKGQYEGLDAPMTYLLQRLESKGRAWDPHAALGQAALNFEFGDRDTWAVRDAEAKQADTAARRAAAEQAEAAAAQEKAMRGVASQALHAATAFQDMRQAAAAVARGDLPATAVNIAQIARHAQLAGTAVGALGGAVTAVGAGLMVFEKTGDYFRAMSNEGMRLQQAFYSDKWAAMTGDLNEVRRVAAGASDEIARLNKETQDRGNLARVFGTPADWKEKIRASVFGADNPFSPAVQGSQARRDEDMARAIEIRSAAIERELELERQLASAESDRYRSVEMAKLKARAAFEQEIHQKETLLRVDKELSAQDRSNIQEQIRLINERKEARLREIEIAGKYPDIEAEVDRDIAAEAGGGASRREAQRERDAGLRKRAQEQEQRDRVERFNVLDDLEKTAEESLRVTRATADLDGEQLEIAKLRAYWEEKIALARKQGGAEGERVARGLEEARDEEIAAVGAPRRRAAAQAAQDARDAGAIQRARDLEQGKTPHYEDAGGIRREKKGSLIDLEGDLGPGEYGPPAPLAQRMSTADHPFKGYASWRDREAAQDAARAADADQRDRALALASERGISESAALKEIRGREGRRTSSPIDKNIQSAADEAESSMSAGAAEAWTQGDVQRHLALLDAIEKKLPGNKFGP